MGRDLHKFDSLLGACEHSCNCFKCAYWLIFMMIGDYKNTNFQKLYYQCIALPTDTMQSDFTPSRAIGMLECGKSFSCVTRILYVSRQVGRWWSHVNQSAMVIKRKSLGRRQKTGERSNRLLIRIARRNRLASSSSLLRLWNEQVSRWTVHRRLIQSGICRYRCPVKQFLFPVDKKAHYRWIQNHICWMKKLFVRGVVWFDESRFLLFVNDWESGSIVVKLSISHKNVFKAEVV